MAFGGTREEHKTRAPWDAQEARRKLADSRRAIGQENCRSAYADLLDAFFFMGKATAHKSEYRAGVHQTARHRRQDSKYGLRLLKLKRRFRDACVIRKGG